ncbi:MAG: hypothetical protein AAFN30_14840, partial [Actinomycetota bacterium]
AVMDRRSAYFNDFNANDQVSQTAIQFGSEAAAEAFVDDVDASLNCSSWSTTTIDGTQQNYTVTPQAIVPGQTFGDDTRAWDSQITFENGFEVTQRSYLVRRFDRVIGLGVVSDEPERVEQAPTFMALMVDRLGYDN